MVPNICTILFDIDDSFMESEYGIQITNGAKSFELIQNLKQLAHAGIQNQMITFQEIGQNTSII